MLRRKKKLQTKVIIISVEYVEMRNTMLINESRELNKILKEISNWPEWKREFYSSVYGDFILNEVTE